MENKSYSEEAKVNAFGEALKNSSFVSSLGFKFERQQYEPPTHKLVGDWWRYTFAGRGGRRLEFRYAPRADNSECVLICIEDARRDDSFYLEDWLNVHNIKSKPDPFKLNTYPGSFREQVDAFVKYLDALFSCPELKAILTGETWEDVPFDWGGMK